MDVEKMLAYFLGGLGVDVAQPYTPDQMGMRKSDFHQISKDVEVSLIIELSLSRRLGMTYILPMDL